MMKTRLVNALENAGSNYGMNLEGCGENAQEISFSSITSALLLLNVRKKLYRPKQGTKISVRVLIADQSTSAGVCEKAENALNKTFIYSASSVPLCFKGFGFILYTT